MHLRAKQASGANRSSRRLFEKANRRIAGDLLRTAATNHASIGHIQDRLSKMVSTNRRSAHATLLKNTSAVFGSAGALRRFTTGKPGERPELPYMNEVPLEKEKMTKEYLEMNAERSKLREELWKYDKPRDKFAQYLKMHPEIAEQFEQQLIPTGFEQLWKDNSQIFAPIPEADVKRELTPQVKADIRNFVLALMEFVRLDEVFLKYPGHVETRLMLQPYLKPGAVDEIQPASAPFDLPSPYDFSKTPDGVIPQTQLSFVETICRGMESWYVARPAAPVHPSVADEDSSNHSLSTAMNIGEWLSSYIVGSAFPTEDMKQQFEMLKAVDHQTFKAYETNMEFAEIAVTHQVNDMLRKHSTQQERVEWFKEYCVEIAELRQAIVEALGPEGLNFVKFKQRQHQRYEHLVPELGDDILYPIPGKKQPDQPAEFAMVLAIGNYLDGAPPESELMALADVQSWEGLHVWHALYRENPVKTMPVAKNRRDLLHLRKELNNLLWAKFSKLNELGHAIDFFRVFPVQRAFVNAMRLNLMVIIDVLFFATLPIKPHHVTPLQAHIHHCAVDNAKLARKMKINLFQFNEGLYIPKDTTGESVYGLTPYEEATYELPSEYRLPDNPKISRQMWQSEIPLQSQTDPEQFREREFYYKWKLPVINNFKRQFKQLFLLALAFILAAAYFAYRFFTEVVLGEEGTIVQRFTNFITRWSLYFFATGDALLNFATSLASIPAWVVLTFILLPVYRLLTVPVESDFEKTVIQYNEALQLLQKTLQVDRAIFEAKMTAELTEDENRRVNAVLFRDPANPALPASDVGTAPPELRWLTAVDDRLDSGLFCWRLLQRQRQAWTQRWTVRAQLSLDLASTYTRQHWARMMEKAPEDEVKAKLRATQWGAFQTEAKACAQLLLGDIKEEGIGAVEAVKGELNSLFQSKVAGR